jgi:K+-transporting ATPase ATPase C chain
MLKDLRPAVLLLLGTTLLTGVVYPLVVTGLGSVLFPDQAGGSLIHRNGVVIGSSLIGQNFTSAKYFHPRPSATTEPDPKEPSKTVSVPYAADNSAASNAGPTAKSLVDRIKGDIDTLRKQNPAASESSIPVDLVTTSGSGLDPDISPAGALYQVERVAAARALPAPQVRRLVMEHVSGRTLGLLGEPTVNVLQLNLDLDALKAPAHGG